MFTLGLWSVRYDSSCLEWAVSLHRSVSPAAFAPWYILMCSCLSRSESKVALHRLHLYWPGFSTCGTIVLLFSEVVYRFPGMRRVMEAQSSGAGTARRALNVFAGRIPVGRAVLPCCGEQERESSTSRCGCGSQGSARGGFVDRGLSSLDYFPFKAHRAGVFSQDSHARRGPAAAVLTK